MNSRLDVKSRRKAGQRRTRATASERQGTAAAAAVESDEPPVAADAPGKRRLIDAAALEFAERGFDGASVLDIAQRAGVKQPLVNYHFGGKEGLWRAVVNEGFHPIRLTSSEEPRAAAEPLLRLKELLLTFAGVNVRHRWIHAIMQKETSSAAGPRLHWLIDTHMLPFNRHLTAQIEACVARGIFKPVQTEQAIVMFTGAIVAVFMASELPERVYGGNLKGSDIAQRYVENVIEVLFQGLMRHPL